MRKRWKIVVGFALLGFAVSAGFYVIGMFYDYTKPPGFLDGVDFFAQLILFPPSILSLACIDCEIGTPSGLGMYAILGLLNAGLYAAIGAAVSDKFVRIAGQHTREALGPHSKE